MSPFRYWRSNPTPAPPAPRHEGKEQRRHGRVRTAAVVCTLGEVLDISASGIRIRCAGRPAIRAGQVVSMTIAGPEGPFSVAVRLIWIRKVGVFRHEVGACFEKLTETARSQLLALVRSAVTVLPVGPDHEAA